MNHEEDKEMEKINSIFSPIFLQIDEMHVPLEIIPEDEEYYWGSVTSFLEVLYGIGYRPVLASKHLELMTDVKRSFSTLFVMYKGSILLERKKPTKWEKLKRFILLKVINPIRIKLQTLEDGDSDFPYRERNGECDVCDARHDA
jgi:hypothetical protein